jgi:hypothetical protein
MNALEKQQFVDSMAEAGRLIKLLQAALQRARLQCHGEVYEQSNLMTLRAYELRVKSEWLVRAVLGGTELAPRGADPEERQGADRRTGVDRRIFGLQRELLPPERPRPALVAQAR